MKKLKAEDFKLTPEQNKFNEREKEPHEESEICKGCDGSGWLGYVDDKDGVRRWIPCKCRQAESLVARLKHSQEIAGLSEYDMSHFLFHTFDQLRQNNNSLGTLLEFCHQWVDHKILFLTVSGPTGIGKTHLAKASVEKVLMNDESVYYCRAVELNKKLRRFEDGEADRYRDMLSSVDNLVLDDVGVEHDPRKYLQSIYHGIIDDRYNTRKPTMVVTNLNLGRTSRNSLASAIGVRAWSRLSEGDMITANGLDLRGIRIAETEGLSVRCKSCKREVREEDIRNGRNDIDDKGICENCNQKEAK